MMPVPPAVEGGRRIRHWLVDLPLRRLRAGCPAAPGQAFGEGEDKDDDLLRNGALVDLYPWSGALRVGSRSYGLKEIEPLFLEGHREGEVTTEGDSVVQYTAYGLELETDTRRAPTRIQPR